MEAKIQPYQYHFIKKQVLTLVEAYQHVSDLTTLQALQSITADRIHEIVGHDYPEIANLIHTVSDITLRKNTANTILANFKDFVIPFEIPSKARLSKLFAKTKKLNVPDFAQQLDSRDLSYLGWNDPGQQQKFITAYHDDTLIGVQGHLATKTQPGFCAICQHHSEVSLFLATTTINYDGTYTKKGDYICRDSVRCNRQLMDPLNLWQFMENVQKK